MVGSQFRFFYPTGRESATGENGQSQAGRGNSRLDWASVIEHLVAHGHPYPALLDYTARQLLLFYRKSIIRMRNERAARTTDTAYGVNGGKDLKGYLDELTAP